jgi:hypothetical protein
MIVDDNLFFRRKGEQYLFIVKILYLLLIEQDGAFANRVFVESYNDEVLSLEFILKDLILIFQLFVVEREDLLHMWYFSDQLHFLFYLLNRGV